MSEEDKNNWEKLIHLPNEYDPDPELAKRAIAAIKAQQEEKKSRKTVSPWVGIAATACVCAVGVAIVLPICLSPKSSEIIYYDMDKIAYSQISDMETYVHDNDLNINFYSATSDLVIKINSQYAYIIESKEVAYLTQEINYIGNVGFDTIDLKIVLISNAKFDFYNDYLELSKDLVVSNINVLYEINTVNENNLYKAMFTYENVPYYLEITTKDEGTEVLEKYIDLLIS